MLRRLARDARNLPVLLALLVALAVVPEIPSPLERPSAGWKGRYVLLYREDAAAAVEAVLAEVAPGTVSRSSARVKIDAFAEIETVRVDALAARLDPVDPRRDAWVAGIGDLFTARSGGQALAAAYVPATRGRLAAALRLGAALRAAAVPRGSWRLLEAEPLALLGAPAAALAFSLAAAGRRRRPRRGTFALAAAGALAWAPGLLNGGPAMLWPCCAALLLWTPRVAADPAGRPARRLPVRASTRATGARIGAVLVVALAALVPGDAAAYRVVRMLASLLSAELLAVAPWEAFVPMPPRARPRLPSWAPIGVIAAAAIAAAVPPALSALRVPLPRTVSPAAAGSIMGLAAASEARRAAPSALPGLPEAVAHARELQAAAFVPVGSPVAPGAVSAGDGEERMRLDAYRFPPGGVGVIEAPVTVLRIDPGWLGRYLAGVPPGSAERLLLEQEQTVVVIPRAAWTPLLCSLPAALAVMVLLALPLAAPRARRLLIRLGLSGITEPASGRRTR